MPPIMRGLKSTALAVTLYRKPYPRPPGKILWKNLGIFSERFAEKRCIGELMLDIDHFVQAGANRQQYNTYFTRTGEQDRLCPLSNYTTHARGADSASYEKRIGSPPLISRLKTTNSQLLQTKQKTKRLTYPNLQPRFDGSFTLKR